MVWGLFSFGFLAAGDDRWCLTEVASAVTSQML